VRRAAPRAAGFVAAALLLAGCPKTGGDPSTTSTSATSASTTTTTVPAATALCEAGNPERIGALTDPAIAELSGLVQSRAHPGVLWVNNDSGDSARVFAINRSGATLREYAMPGASARDWEDITLMPGAPGGPGDQLYIGDIGDNAKARADITVYAIPEPDPAHDTTAQPAQSQRLLYPDGAHDAETLFVDPVSRDLFIVTKELSGKSQVFRKPGGLLSGQPTLTSVTTLDLGLAQLVTSGDVSADGATIVLRTYNEVFVWDRRRGEDVGTALQRQPCRAPAPQDRQGEAIGLDPDGRGYVTSSEGVNAPIWHVGGTAP
jgi:hypothetical protein